jgi:hypothetical protein
MNQPSTEITEGQIQQALRQFRLAGGQIRRMPDQVAPRQALVRSRWDTLAGLTESAPVRPQVAPEASAPAGE